MIYMYRMWYYFDIRNDKIIAICHKVDETGGYQTKGNYGVEKYL